MSLPVGERRKLRAIERAQATADPDLAARFSLFSQLSWYEEMPLTERLNARAIRRRKRAEQAIIAYLNSGPDLLLRAGRRSARPKLAFADAQVVIGECRDDPRPAQREFR
jgi:hypothetical protein